MRRKQPSTPQRRSEPREPDASGQNPPGFSAFTASSERPASGLPGGRPAAGGAGPKAPSGPGGPAGPGGPGGPGGRGPAGGPDVLAGGGDRPPSGSRYESLAFRNWRVPVRLVAILLIPVIIGLVFGGLRVNTSFDSYTKASHDERAAELARAATNLANAYENERDLSAIPLMTGQDPQGEVAKLRAQSDQALVAYQAAYKKVAPDNDAELAARNSSFSIALSSLQALRQNAYGPELFATATAAAYEALIDPLLAFDNSIGGETAAGVSRARSIYAMSLAKASASDQRALMLTLMTGVQTQRVTRYENSELIEQLLVANKLQQVAMTEFQTGSDDADNKVFADATVAQSDADANAPQRMPDGHTLPTTDLLMNIGLAFTQAAQTGDSQGVAQANAAAAAAQAAGLTSDNWLQATNTVINPQHVAETKLLNSVVQDSTAERDNAQSDAITNAAIVIASLALAGLLTGFIARSMILGMRVLNTSALDIANHRLPDLVEKLSKTDPDRVDTNVEPIALWGKDEIGEVARAFDQVHRQAVSLAAEQALLRGNLNAIFSNLSRRSQSLIQRQLALITDLENNEADPDQLENLFKLDHLATRMRRNGENLLVLAGEEPGRRWNTPVPLVDVLRAAASEVEQYERIELSNIPEAEVVGAAVTDLVHLLAELLENATSFSSPQTRVNVNATRLPDGRVLVEIHDKGIGLTAEDFAEINEKLAEPPTVDAAISRRMGLFVVGRLSDRHGIRVQLRPSGESAGTTSLVMLPPQLTQMQAMPEPEEEFTVSRIFADQEPQAAGWQAPSAAPRSAAELGFDDNLAVGRGGDGFSPALESMQRSQRIDQRRRAALEAGPGEEAGQPAPAKADFAGPEFAEPEFVEAEFVESEPETAEYPQPPYAEQGYPAQQPYGQDQYQDQYQGGYYADQGYQEQAYPEQQQYAQEQYQGGYQEQAYGRQDGFFASQGYAEQQPHAEQGYQGGYGNDPYQPERFDGFQQGSRRPETPAQHPYQAETPALPAGDALGSGLPLRRPGQQLNSNLGATRAIGTPGADEQPNWFTGARDTSADAAPARGGHEVSALGGSSTPTGPSWQSQNDADWQRAEQLREPSSSGVTGSGLPRRVPKQNLVAGNAKSAAQDGASAPQDGPQVSRNPEEVRGRLTNLRRGVEQGRNSGSTGSFRIDPTQPGRSGQGQHNSSTDLFGGSNHQER
ncbi:nitrate- and nitrite sensing domain-containing protein [Kitasatospora sp. NPDC052896]|uniref:sensor histidine kinase n=1 Tax=Kitasatospora sp. NPDC052896 TaxID=3364061 RepID=UPI0037C9DB4E